MLFPGGDGEPLGGIKQGFILQRSPGMHPYDGFQGQDGRLGGRLRGWWSMSETLAAWTKAVASGRKRRAQIGEIFKETGDGWTGWFKGRKENPHFG